MSLPATTPPGLAASPPLPPSSRPSLAGRRILLADPDTIFLQALVEPFEAEGLHVFRCDDLPHLRHRLTGAAWDVLILDPAIAGATPSALFGEIARLPTPPALIVTAPAMSEVDRIIALEMGADHCVSKPCSAAEMLARVGALLGRRRATAAGLPSGTAYFADLAFDPQRRLLYRRDGGRQRLSTAEADLLTLFLRNPRRILDRDALRAGTAAGPGNDRGLRAIDVLVSRLRADLTAAVPVIVTVRGQGYILPHGVRWDSARPEDPARAPHARIDSDRGASAMGRTGAVGHDLPDRPVDVPPGG